MVKPVRRRVIVVEPGDGLMLLLGMVDIRSFFEEIGEDLGDWIMENVRRDGDRGLGFVLGMGCGVVIGLEFWRMEELVGGLSVIMGFC